MVVVGRSACRSGCVVTPTISGASAIEREYEASDQRRYFVPCPHCSHRQWLRFEQLRFDFTDNNVSKFPAKYGYAFGRTYFLNIVYRMN